MLILCQFLQNNLTHKIKLAEMSHSKLKQINVSVSRITNWQDPQSQADFEISFYAKNDGGLLTSKYIKGQYARDTKSMKLNSLVRIEYAEDENTVILRLNYSMRSLGQIALGEFIIDFQTLTKQKKLNFTINQVKSQSLIVQEYVAKPRREDDKNQQAKLHGGNYGIQKYQNSRNDSFIKQRQDFLERHSNRSGRSSNYSAGKNFFSSRVNELLQQVKSYKQNKIIKESNQSSKQNLNSSLIKVSRKSNRSENKNLHKPTNRFRTDKSQNHSERTNESSQKYILLLKNLNVVPCEEYYQTCIKKVVTSRRCEYLRKPPANHYYGSPYIQPNIQDRKLNIKNGQHRKNIYSQYY